MIKYDWLTAEQIEWLVNPALQMRGMAQLNPACCRVLGAWDGERLISTLTIQLVPMLGPLIRHDNAERDNGEVSRDLTNRMHDYLEESDARGYMVVADSPLTRRLCERYKMSKLVSPVYVSEGRDLECNDYTGAKVVQ